MGLEKTHTSAGEIQPNRPRLKSKPLSGARTVLEAKGIVEGKNPAGHSAFSHVLGIVLKQQKAYAVPAYEAVPLSDSEKRYIRPFQDGRLHFFLGARDMPYIWGSPTGLSFAFSRPGQEWDASACQAVLEEEPVSPGRLQKFLKRFTIPRI
jgi:hypothetical protein